MYGNQGKLYFRVKYCSYLSSFLPLVGIIDSQIVLQLDTIFPHQFGSKANVFLCENRTPFRFRIYWQFFRYRYRSWAASNRMNKSIYFLSKLMEKTMAFQHKITIVNILL